MLVRNPFLLEKAYEVYNGEHVWKTLTSADGVIGVRFTSSKVGSFVHIDETSPAAVSSMDNDIQNSNKNRKVFHTVLLLVPFRITLDTVRDGNPSYFYHKYLRRIECLNKIARLTVAYQAKYNKQIQLVLTPSEHDLNMQFDMDERLCILQNENRITFGCLIQRQQEYITGSSIPLPYDRFLLLLDGAKTRNMLLESFAVKKSVFPSNRTDSTVVFDLPSRSSSTQCRAFPPLPPVRKIPIIKSHTNYEHTVLTSFKNYKSIANARKPATTSNNNNDEDFPTIEEDLCFDDDYQGDGNKYRCIGKYPKVVIDDEENETADDESYF
jgi:hypothetical protein